MTLNTDHAPGVCRVVLCQDLIRLDGRTLYDRRLNSHLSRIDIDLFKRAGDLEAGLTITTNREPMRKLFEPGASPVGARIKALEALHDAGLKTYAFIGPILPMDPDKLAEEIAPHAGKVLIDRMNYPWKVRKVYQAHGLSYALGEDYAEECEARLAGRLRRLGTEVEII